jgi:glycerol-3-phosphate acyltransferase PlsX
MDYRRYGAAPLLGVNGKVFIGHGRSDAEAIANAIRTADEAERQGVLDQVRAAISAGEQAAFDGDSGSSPPLGQAAAAE